MSDCLDDETVALLVSGNLDGDREARARKHVESCATCRDLVAHLRHEEATTRAYEQGPPDPEAFPVGFEIGRYVVQRKLGRGGMGVVLLAYDPELDRKVAIKVLLPGREDNRERLVREARSMARLVHPNVLTIHDVGVANDRVYLAMEYVEGATLRGFLAEKKRPLGEIIDVFTLAGRGLAAAHAAGIVHRDFKPDNVLVGRDGRIRVSDFGLAHASRDHAPPSSSSDEAPLSFGKGLTRTGSVLGTPAYMAPEQHAAGRSTPRTDQFAFAVALWEALFEQKPFRGKSYDELAKNIREGALEVPRKGKVPRRIVRALRRALSVDPEDRFASMDALLAAIAPRSRVRVLGGVAAALGIVTLYVVLRPHAAQPAPTVVCAGVESEMAGVWNARERADLQTSLSRADVPPASTASRDETASRVVRQLDAYAESWVAASKDACEATNVRHAQTEETLQLRTACLQQRRAEMNSLVVALKKADAFVIDRALPASLQLTPIETCSDVASLLARGPAPPAPAVSADVDRIRATLRDARALSAAGHGYDGEKLAAQVVADARKLEYRPVLAEALLADGEMSSGTGARDALLEAIWLGEASHHDVIVARAWVALIHSATLDRAFDEVESWSQRASASIERLEGQSALKAELLGALAGLRYALGGMVEARDLSTSALRTRASPPQRETLDDAADLEHRAMAEIALDERDAAEKDLHDELAIMERLLGPDYDEADVATFELGRIEAERGAWDDALAHYTKARALAEKRFERTHDRVVRVKKDPRSNLARILAAEAPAYGIEQLELVILFARGEVLEARGDLDGAYTAFDSARRDAVELFGERSRETVGPVASLAELELRRGHTREALRFARSSNDAARGVPPSGPTRIAAKIALAGALGATGDRKGGLAALAEIPSGAKLSARLRARADICRAELEGTSPDSATESLGRAGRLADPERQRLDKRH